MEEPVPSQPGWYKLNNHGLVYYVNKTTGGTVWSLTPDQHGAPSPGLARAPSANGLAV
jgi:hypothetical protein